MSFEKKLKEESLKKDESLTKIDLKILETLGLNEFGENHCNNDLKLISNLISFIDKGSYPNKITMDTGFYAHCYRDTSIEKYFDRIPLDVTLVERKGRTYVELFESHQ